MMATNRRPVAKRPPTPTDAGAHKSALTTRERDVLELLAHGATYDEVARMLRITTNTVRTHVRAIYPKLDASSKTEALREAVRLGYVLLPTAEKARERR